MEYDDATQPATQKVHDPRREGQSNSGLQTADLTDIVCVLHPCSPAAHEVVERLAQTSPQHIWNNGDLLRSLQSQAEASTLFGEDPRRHGHALIQPEYCNHDIALRLTSRLKDVTMGWTFGRNPIKSDVHLCVKDPERRLSNIHFRIFFNSDNILMLEDCSTNGTKFDEILLRLRNPEGAKEIPPISRMLTTGSIIELIAGTVNNVKFVVRTFNDRYPYDDEYEDKVEEYMQTVEAEKQRAAEKLLPLRRQHAELGNGNTVGNIFQQNIGQPPNGPAPAPPPRTRGGSRNHHISKKWNGGDKYNYVKEIGKGAFATVFEVATKQDGKLFAAKEIQKRQMAKNGVEHQIDNEMLIMERLRHVR